MRRCLATVLAFLCLFTTAVRAETVVPILMYHNLNEHYLPENANVEMTPDEFEDQVRALLENGYTPITLSDYAAWENGEAVLPSKPIIITFDDGYLNNYTHAYPIAKELQIPITIFVVTDRMGMSDGVVYPHFTWEQAKEMQDSGLVEIESHTNKHSDFQLADSVTTAIELRLSRYLIYKNLGKLPQFLAYPYGKYTEEVQTAAKLAGYTACVKIEQDNPQMNRKGDDLYALKRITACGGMSGADLIALLEAVKER